LSTFPAFAVFLLALGASEHTPGGPSAAVARISAVERDLCLASCPAIPATADSDWLCSAEGQKANGCHLGCRTEQPGATLYRDLTELGAASALKAETPLVKLAGKDGPELSRRLQLAVREGDGRRLGPLCTRARESLGTRDEAAFLECIGRSSRPEAFTPPDASRALRCATVYAERDLDWLRRCVSLEQRTDIEACVTGDDGSRRHGGRSRRACESDAVERLADAFRGPSR